MKTIHELMLKDTPYEIVLHKSEPKSPLEAVSFLDALDFVVKEWNEAMHAFDVEGQDDVSMEILGNLIECRILFCDLDNEEQEITFTEAIKVLGRLKQSMMSMAKSYARTPSLAHWYLSLPLMVHGCYNNLRREIRGNRKSS